MLKLRRIIRKVPSRRELKRLESVGKPVEKPLDSEALRIVAFSDYRVQDISLLLDFIRELHPRPNLILYAGDDVERFHTQSENLFEHLATTSTHGLCAVLGNDPPQEDEESKNKDVYVIPDTRALRRYIRGAGVYNVHEAPLVIGDYAVIGIEGAPTDERLGPMGVVIYSEASIARHLRLAAKSARGKRLILVSHCPPRGSLDFAIRFGKRPIGSVALRTFLRKRRDVPLVVCGHVHYCGGHVIPFVFGWFPLRGIFCALVKRL
jgi:Icc-related predicted phosphoesterase